MGDKDHDCKEQISIKADVAIVTKQQIYMVHSRVSTRTRREDSQPDQSAGSRGSSGRRIHHHGCKTIDDDRPALPRGIGYLLSGLR